MPGPDEYLRDGEDALDKGELSRAIDALQRAVKGEPSNARAHNLLGTAYDRSGQWERAAQSFERAFQLDDRSAEFANNLGIARQALHQDAAAIRAYERAVALAPDAAESHVNLASLKQAQGELETAIKHYATALSLAPEFANSHYLMATAQLANGDATAALEFADACLRIEPTAPDALALRAIALNDLGRTDDCRALLDYDRFVVQQPLSPPPGFPNIRKFNRELERYVMEESTLTPDPYGASTRGGKHSDDLMSTAKGPAQSLKGMLQEAFSAYVGSLPIDSAHPFLGAELGELRLVAQANILSTEGYLIPHVHPHSWVSGAYYVRVPREIRHSDENQRGWLKFGDTPDEIRNRVPLPAKTLVPEEGMLVLFPSYFYHGTLPFQAKRQRMSLGVDVIAE